MSHGRDDDQDRRLAGARVLEAPVGRVQNTDEHRNETLVGKIGRQKHVRSIHDLAEILSAPAKSGPFANQVLAALIVRHGRDPPVQRTSGCEGDMA